MNLSKEELKSRTNLGLPLEGDIDWEKLKDHPNSFIRLIAALPGGDDLDEFEERINSLRRLP